jgi:glycosyltransferase involved in cell wall biosynthesis/peptidoglycan/xylan/chitin deacetylase (PgdA/CDA1 family)
MEVSVIVPAHNAASTLAETLESLRAQRFTRWEAIVVDDGSTDETATIAAAFVSQDSRIRVVSQPQAGESGARNVGVKLAHHDWLLFLDSDDWLLPDHLERLTNALALDPNRDGAICGWTRVAPGGRLSAEKHCPQPDNVFELSTRCSPFAIHACVVRRSFVESVGGFDKTLRTCADWDLWQRIARMGARFLAIPDVLARYRMRPDSAGVNGPQILSDALRVITRGHLPDPRVVHPASAYANGLSAESLPRAKFHFACWAAGLIIGRGEDACFLLASLGAEHEVALDPNQVAWMLFESVLLPNCRVTADWVEIWPGQERRLDIFLQALETQSQAPGLAARSRNILERLAIEHSTLPRPLTVGRTHGARIELTESLADIVVAAPAERLLCETEMEGKRLGTLELPICDGLVPSYVLADAIVAEYAWPILGRFFERTLYKHLDVKRETDGVSIWKGDFCLAEGLRTDEEAFWSHAHDRIGWALFAHEFWATTWPGPDSDPQTITRQVAKDDCYSAEVSGSLPDIEVSGSELQFIPTVGGSALGVINIPTRSNRVSALEIRAAVEAASGFELGRAAVREGVLGQPLDAVPTSLRERLKIAALRMAQTETEISISGEEDCSGICLEPRVSSVLHRSIRRNTRSVLFAARAAEVIGTSASRRAMLPAAAAAELLEAATLAGEVVVRLPENGEPPDWVAYAPDLISCLPPHIQMPPRSDALLADASARQQTFANLSSKSQRDHSAHDHKKQDAIVKLPILMYHRVAPKGDAALARYRVTPQSFEEQLRYLRDAGYYSVSLEEWRIFMRKERPLPRLGVLLTFDDGYLDFLTYAWPLLQHYGFAATVFLVAEEIGKTNRWDRARGEEVDLLGWEHIRHLQDEGVEFGSHSASHRPLSGLSPVEIVREAARSRAILIRELRRAPRAFAYPHGAEDGSVRHLIGACGYVFGLSCQFRLSGFYDSLLALPRIEVTGSDTLTKFKKKLGGLEA